MGGWGPLEYLHILKNEGMQLQPEVAVVGLYLGNDLFDATRSVYGESPGEWTPQDAKGFSAIRALPAMLHARGAQAEEGAS